MSIYDVSGWRNFCIIHLSFSACYSCVFLFLLWGPLFTCRGVLCAMMNTGAELQRIGRYELRTRLGRNNLSGTWKAYDPRQQCEVDLKVLSANTRDYPNFPLLFPRLQPDTALAYIVEDYIEWQTLSTYMRTMPRSGMMPPWADIVQLFTYVGMAVDHAHQNGVVHGNLKPANVIIGRPVNSTGRAVAPIVTDFGLARMLGMTAGLLPNRSIESLFYISPEQAKGQPATERSDIYSLGILLYEICTGMVPFQGSRPVALMMQHVSAMPPSPALVNPNIPPALTNVVMRSLAKEPEERFASAASMTIAMEKALHVPVPERLGHLVEHAESDRPIRNVSAGSAPSSFASSISSKNRYATASTRAVSLDEKQQEIDGKGSRPSVATTFPQGRRREKRRKNNATYMALGFLLVLTLLVTGLGSYALLHDQSAASSGVVGHAFFVSSGQLNEHSSTQGINDEVQIDLSGISAPAPGKSFYAWLLPDKVQEEALPIFLGKLPVNNGTVHYLYTGGKSHINLLNVTSRFLITEEDAAITPTIPTPDTHAWRYYAELAQVASPGDKLHFSKLDHLRHLLVESPELQARNLHGGLVIWLVQNTQRVLDLENNARDSWQAGNYATSRAQIVSLLDFLDSHTLARSELPPGSPALISQHNADIALLGLDPKNPDPPGYAYNNEVSPGYVYLIGLHLSGMLLSPDVTQDQRNLALRVNTALEDVAHELIQVRSDALKLLQMSNGQFSQPTTLTTLNDMVTLSQSAYAGQLNQTSGQAQGGVVWIYGNMQRLADFAVKPYAP